MNDCDTPTIYERNHAAELALKARAAEHPLVKAAFDAFPGARILAVHTPEAAAREAVEEALPEVEDEWDPFEEE